MAVFSNLLILGYVLVPPIIGAYLLMLLSRFVKAQQRATGALCGSPTDRPTTHEVPCMKRWFAGLALAALLPLSATAQSPRLPELRDELLQMRDVDQAVRAGALTTPEEIEAMSAADARHTARLKQIVAAHGWPSTALVGEDGAQAAWLLAQHADADPDFQREVLALIEPLVASGDVQAANYAYLWDRTHAPQRYGTQGRCVGEDAWAPREIEDEEGLEARRAEVGLPPMADYIPRVSTLCRLADPTP
ncbi:DUF6624 domain-containing protein [Luteimonas abyssi]|uniref:DUF6624 domain-containing protein n=1 Tax=Luteimonas abyssi TaxID=1247514 RepID=UPI000737B20B|nr:DUF6624 domain-containing protein [Luteimonas abyssi]